MSPARTSASAKKAKDTPKNKGKSPKRLVTKDLSLGEGSVEKVVNDADMTWNGMKLVKISIEHCKS